MSLNPLVLLAFRVSLLLTVVGFGLRATPDDALRLFRRPGVLSRSLLAMFVVVPLAVIVLVQLFAFLPNVEVVLVVLSISPVPPALPRQIKSGARSSFALGLLVAVSLLSIVVVPLLIALLGLYAGRSFAMMPAALAAAIVQNVVVPLMVGMMVRGRLPSVANRLEDPVDMVAAILLVAATLVLVAGNLSTLWALVGNGTVAAIAAFVAIGLAAGHGLGGSRPGEQAALAVACACRHPGIALTLATANFPRERFGGLILFYLVVSALITVPYVKWQQRRIARITAA